MAFIPGSIADGQLPSSKGTLYTVPTGYAAEAIIVRLVATSTTTSRTVNIYVKRSGSSSRRIIPRDMGMNVGDAASVVILGLSAGDLIEGDASAASEIDYTITADLTA